MKKCWHWQDTHTVFTSLLHTRSHQNVIFVTQTALRAPFPKFPFTIFSEVRSRYARQSLASCQRRCRAARFSATLHNIGVDENFSTAEIHGSLFPSRFSHFSGDIDISDGLTLWYSVPVWWQVPWFYSVTYLLVFTLLSIHVQTSGGRQESSCQTVGDPAPAPAPATTQSDKGAGLKVDTRWIFMCM